MAIERSNPDIQRFVLSQGAAGTTEIAAAAPGQFHKVIGFLFTMDADGSAQFQSGATNLSGAFDLLAKSPIGFRTETRDPLFVGDEGGNLELVTVTGKAKGIVLYYTEGD